MKHHVPLSDERLHDLYQFKLESNPEASKALIEKSGNQPTASLNDVMEHLSRVDAMLNSKKQSMSTMLKKKEGKPKEGSSGGSSDWSCYTYGEVGHPTWTCPNKEIVLAA